MRIRWRIELSYGLAPTLQIILGRSFQLMEMPIKTTDIEGRFLLAIGKRP